jgi:nucleoside-diphosphate-sugar epimerase
MGAVDRPPSSSGVAEDAGGRPPSSSGDAAESDADLAVTARVVDFSGVRAWLPRADTRLSRVLGTALRDAGCAVHGARAGGEELAFATETFVAATELHNPEHERARRACVRACHLAVATLPGDAGEIRSLAEALTSAARADGTKRALIVVSPPRAVVGRSASASASSASSTASREKRDGKKDEAARSPPGAAGVCADAERVALRLHRPGSLEVFVMRHGVLYGEGEFADGFLSVMRAAWEGRSVPVFGVGDNVLRLCHARKLAEGVVRVAARALLGVVMPSDRAKQTTPSVFSNADAREEGDGAGESGDEADRDDRSAARPSAVGASRSSPRARRVRRDGRGEDDTDRDRVADRARVRDDAPAVPRVESRSV